MRKTVIVIMALVVALAALPVTFACYNGGWHNWGWGRYWHPSTTVYDCTTSCQLCFTNVNAHDNEATFAEPKDVGDTQASIMSCDKLLITISNAYPGYQGIVDFCLKNTGNMAATITGITTNYPDPTYLQIDLTGDIQVGTVIQTCQAKCGQLVIGGLPQENTQDRSFTFEITLNYTCTCTPSNCETAYAYGGCLAHCFLSNYLGHSFTKWGWTNGLLNPGIYTFNIYAGAAQCNISKGKWVGTLTVNYNGYNHQAVITYNMFPGYKMDETHLYVGSEPWPRDSNGNYTVAPGQYPYWHDLNNASTDSYTITGLSGKIYIIAHAVVCW